MENKDNAILQLQPDGRKVIRFRPLPAADTPKAVDRLIRLFNESLEGGKTDAILLIAAFVLDFESIHPFLDGNGRIGRLLTLLLLYQTGYHVGRYISLERIIEDSKETYYEAFYKSSQGWHTGEHDLRDRG